MDCIGRQLYFSPLTVLSQARDSSRVSMKLSPLSGVGCCWPGRGTGSTDSGKRRPGQLRGLTLISHPKGWQSTSRGDGRPASLVGGWMPWLGPPRAGKWWVRERVFLSRRRNWADLLENVGSAKLPWHTCRAFMALQCAVAPWLKNC